MIPSKCNGRSCKQGTHIGGGHYVCPHNCLATLRPNLLLEWDFEKNTISPYLITPGSGKIVHWICPKSSQCTCGECHRWSTTLNNRTCTKGATNCPYCNGSSKVCKFQSLQYVYPKIAEEWDPIKNDRSPSEVSCASHYNAYWICKKNSCGCHNWSATVKNRTINNSGCPFCAVPRRYACPHYNIKLLYPIICLEWNFEKNTDPIETICPGSGNKAFWKCKKGHEWIASPTERTRDGGKGTGCPKCLYKTEGKVYDFLKDKFTLNPVKQFDWCKNNITKQYLSFDIHIKDLKVLIEIDGEQHFKQVLNWCTVEYTQMHDTYKTFCANANGYTVIRVLRLDVWYDKNDWQNKLVESIKKYDKPDVIYLSSDVNIYMEHKTKLSVMKLGWLRFDGSMPKYDKTSNNLTITDTDDTTEIEDI